MRLIITEKPSVAYAYAHALGVKEKKDGYIEGSGSIISWCLGHLEEMASPEVYDEKYAVWRKEDLPIIPGKTWKYVIPKPKQTQFKTLKALMERGDVSEVVNACDAGREGELIFRNLYNIVGCSKPMKRLWLSSMEEDAIREGFENLHDGSEYDSLYHAALCRAQADWLVGMNATRLFSVLYHRTLNVGRVLSPTLAMLVQRESEISAFEPTPFYTPVIRCGALEITGDHCADKEDAAMVLNELDKNVTVMRIEQTEKSVKPPALFDLTTLQREANRRCGFTAQQTLDYLQSLYEKKLCTYPRTDSRYLTDDMEGMVKALTLRAAELCGVDVSNPINPSVICDSKKVTDHHALVPTATAAGMGMDDLPEGERKVLGLVCWGVLRAVAGDYRYTETVTTLKSGGHTFTVKGKTVIDLGWMRYEKKEREQTLPELSEGQELLISNKSVRQGKTVAPSHYTEDTLLGDMECAGSKELPNDAERRGIGTPATRAAVLEKLVAGGFVARKIVNKQVRLIPTQAASSLITVLPEQLQSPLLTAEWETRLKMVERGELSPAIFLYEIEQMLREMVADAKAVPGSETLFPSGRPVIGKCPRCGGDVTESRAGTGFFCESNDCHFGLWKDNRYLTGKRIELTREMAKSLLDEGQVFVRGMYSPRTDTTFDAMLVLADDGDHMRYKVSFDYGE